MTRKFIGRLIERHALGTGARCGGDLPYLIDSTDQSASFWSRRNLLDCNFLVGSPSGHRSVPSSEIVDILPHFLYPSLYVDTSETVYFILFSFFFSFLSISSSFSIFLVIFILGHRHHHCR